VILAVVFVLMSRDHTQILVVEQPLDILAFEKTGKYKACIMFCMERFRP
jgi:recombinational DNA repair protein RecR